MPLYILLYAVVTTHLFVAPGDPIFHTAHEQSVLTMPCFCVKILKNPNAKQSTYVHIDYCTDLE